MVAMPLKAVLVAEGSGGHLIPALEVAKALAGSGARVKIWYAKRRQTEGLVQALVGDIADARIDVEPLPIELNAHPLQRLQQCRSLWRKSARCFETFAPDVVVGFGGWVSAPVILAARIRGIRCLVHEQNVVMGRANRWLVRWVHGVAVSFQDTQRVVRGAPSIVTGMPIREHIGDVARDLAVPSLGLSADRLTLLVVGGSQGSRSLNQLLMHVSALLSTEERNRWQLVHVTGPADEASVRAAYRSFEVTASVVPFLADMGAAYAHADVVLARAGASTIAELARCGKPAILIPYPHAGAHQQANARIVQGVGGGLIIEESDATPTRVVSSVRRILHDERLRLMMGAQMRTLDVADAAGCLARAITELARGTLQARSAHPSEYSATRFGVSTTPVMSPALLGSDTTITHPHPSTADVA